MNQQSKKLLFNKSTFLSLKAELLKKQEEVKGKKQLPQHKVENYKPPPVARTTLVAEKRDTFKEKIEKEVDTDELEAQQRVKAALQRKTELYNHLSDGSGTSQLAARFLVDFRTKGEDERRETDNKVNEEKRDEIEKPTEYGDDDDDDDDWTSFTDCLGRTRRCLKTDLELYKRRDEEIGRALGHSEQQRSKQQTEQETHEEEEIGPKPEKPLLVQKTDAFLQSLREKWEQKEKELLERDRDIHYQDLIFDEARAHGVGYYNFSTDEASRRREQAQLERVRAETRRAQEEASAKREERDRLIAQRVAAARARKRQRAGLPPEDPEEKNEEFQLSSILDFLTEQKNEAAKKAKEEEERRREEREIERQKLREHYVREWDIGKDGTGDGKKFRELTQEEYEEQQRSKRIAEFAPANTSLAEGDNVFDEKGRFIGGHMPPPTVKTWADVRKNNVETKINVPRTSSQSLYFSSKESKKYSNFVQASEPVPIVNELEEEVEEPRSKISRRNNVGVEVEPPPTYDYYGPEVKHSRPGKRQDLRESYEQGLKFLQDIESKKNASRNKDFNL